MTFTKSRFVSFEDYLAADPSDLPEGLYEYWDGELVKVRTESLFNDTIANYLYLLLVQRGIFYKLVRPGKVEVCVPGKPRTRLPDLVILEEVHITLLEKRATITQTMPPPKILMEIVSPGNETSENYTRDYKDKPMQYASIGVPEIWLIDPDRAWVQVGTLKDCAYEYQTFMGEEIIVSPGFPELVSSAAEVLQTK